MSKWAYVNGVVTVRPPGDGQRAKDFVLGSVVDHLPMVEGSEGPMHVEIVRRDGHGSSCNTDEFGQFSNLGVDHFGFGGHSFEEQGRYDLLLEGALRDVTFDEALKSFCTWMTRLSKRVWVEDVLVRVSGYGDGFDWRKKVFDGAEGWADNFEDWSWVDSERSRPFKYGGVKFNPMHEARHSTNWRYGQMPWGGNWTETLVNVVPGGNQLAMELDYLAGNLEPFEYGGSEAYEEKAVGFERKVAEARKNLKLIEERYPDYFKEA